MTAREPMDVDLSRMQCDLGFMEAINQSMQVPSRLKVAEESIQQDDAEIKDDPPLSFQMHIPNRISLVGMTDVSVRPFLLNQVQENSLVRAYDTIDHSTIGSVESPFLKVTTRSGMQKHQRKASLKKSKRERSESEHTSLTVRTVDQPHYRQEKHLTSAPHFPSFTENGKIYSLQNICRTVRFLGCLLSHRLQDSLHSPTLPSVPALMENGGSEPGALGKRRSLSWPQLYSLQEVRSEYSDGHVKELGMLEVAAMRKQLNTISGRLQILEEERTGRHQKEVVIFSVLLTACFINAWLWLRR
ncbi:mitochondrial fission factor isoform X1 [Microcaecilia unicolor]|uniref:Mitochondrial fission factor n=1 Tax=Microcaecilia unicolor TaxID=1415580 RepID=A0A6P7YKE8_9AMPH|nr:mitochondrial fission factor-like isoform X1 [Microcaecilia unicolor]